MKILLSAGPGQPAVEFTGITQVVVSDDLGNPITAGTEILSDGQTSHIKVLTRDEQGCGTLLGDIGYGRRLYIRGDLKSAVQKSGPAEGDAR